LKYKSETFSTNFFITKFIKKQTDHKIKILKSDQGREYKSNDFNDYYQKEGLKKCNNIYPTPKWCI